MRGGSATAAVNGAIEALVRTLAVELAPVRVNAVSPGIVATPTWNTMTEDDRTVQADPRSGSVGAAAGHPVTHADDLRAARRRAGLPESITFHDLRHTGNTNHRPSRRRSRLPHEP